MKQIRIYETGGPEVMRLEDVPLPEPGPGAIRLKIEAAGVNFIDTYQRSGQYKVALPFTPGMEAAGVVDAVGAGVTEFQPGDRAVCGFGGGAAYAEYAVFAADKLVPLPDGVEMQVAAAAILQGMTAHYLVNDTFPLAADHTALIHAAAGGTGQLLVQMAKRRGARVIATAGTAHKAQIARELGADAVIVYSEQDFEAEVKALTDGRGVDVVYDSVGKDTFDKGLNCLKPRGMMVLFGQASGAVAPLDPQILNAKGSLFLTRPSLGAYIPTRADLLRRAGDVFAGVRDGWLKVSIGRRFPLAQAADAHRALAGRATTGKVLLLPG